MAIEDLMMELNDNVKRLLTALATTPVEKATTPVEKATPAAPKRGRPPKTAQDTFYHDKDTDAYIRVPAGDPPPTRKSLEKISEDAYLAGVEEEPINGKAHEPEQIDLAGVRAALFALRDRVAQAEGDPEAGKAAARSVIERVGRAKRIDDIDPKHWLDVVAATREEEL